MYLWLRLTLLAQMAAALHGGLLLRFEATDHGGSEPQTTISRMIVDGDKAALDTQVPSETSEPINTVIYHASTRTMYAVNHPLKAIHTLDEQAFGGLPDTAERMRVRLKNLPPQRRAEAERALRERFGGSRAEARQRPKPEIIPSGAATEINGFRCEIYEVKRQGEKERELCVTSWSNIPGGSEITDVMKDMAKFTEAVINVMRRSSPIGSQQHLLADLDQLPGFPVSAKEYAGGKLTRENVLKSAIEQGTDPETFTPPKNYVTHVMRRNH